MVHHRDVDWSLADPYELGKGDNRLAGYSAVVRFFHRFAVLYEHHELNRKLASRLLSREAGYWSALLFEPMATRRGMFTQKSVAELCAALSKGEGKASFNDGAAGQPPSTTVPARVTISPALDVIHIAASAIAGVCRACNERTAEIGDRQWAYEWREVGRRLAKSERSTGRLQRDQYRPFSGLPRRQR